MSLARLSLTDFRKGTQEQRSSFARAIVANFAKCGFIKLDDHGFDEDNVKEMFEWNHRFFQLGIDVRESCAHVPGPYPQRGYNAIGAENLARFHSKWTGETGLQDHIDYKELFDIGPEDDVEFPNQWPAETAIPGFRAHMTKTYQQFEQINREVLSALELGMDLPSGSFTDKCIRHASEFRFAHYPALKAEMLNAGTVSRASPHYDIGVLTFLFQDDVGGLEMSGGREGDKFVSVTSESPTDLIVNTSETLQRWSNNLLKAGLHQVTVPPSMSDGGAGDIPERHSIIYFSKADRTASVAPIPDLISKDHPALYTDMTALQYHQRRIATAYA